MLTRRSLPSSVIIVPQYTTNPFNGTREYSLRRCCVPDAQSYRGESHKLSIVLVIAPRTDSRFTRLLIFEAVPYSSASILATREIWSRGGITKEIIEVPFPRASVSDFTSFFTFHISTCLSEAFVPCLLLSGCFPY